MLFSVFFVFFSPVIIKIKNIFLFLAKTSEIFPLIFLQPKLHKPRQKYRLYYFPPPHANSFVLGPAVINTHTHFCARPPPRGRETEVRTAKTIQSTSSGGDSTARKQRWSAGGTPHIHAFAAAPASVAAGCGQYDSQGQHHHDSHPGQAEWPITNSKVLISAPMTVGRYLAWQLQGLVQQWLLFLQEKIKHIIIKLPHPWQQHVSSRTGKFYWYNPDTKETIWICLTPKVNQATAVYQLYTQVCVLLLQDLVQSCSRGGGEDSGGHVLRETTSRGLCGLVCPSRTSEHGR